MPEIDLLRGVVMVLMALDHVRFYFLSPGLSPTDLSQTTTWHFLTFWVTRFCAPVFVFLAGLGVFLRRTREAQRSPVIRFLLTRGLWLIFLQFTLVQFSWTFSLDPGNLEGEILWVIGCAMMALAGLMYLPRWAILMVGILLIGGHALWAGVPAGGFGPPHWLDVAFHESKPMVLWTGVRITPAYPLLPWVGLMAVGYVSGDLLLRSEPRSRRRLAGLGAALTLGFLVLRGLHVFLSPDQRNDRSGVGPLVLSFLDCDNYPVLLFLMTLGPAVAFLAVPAAHWGRAGKFGMVFGQVPLFFYLAHIPLIHLVALGYGAANAAGSVSPEMDFLWPADDSDWLPEQRPQLLVVYVVWVGVVLVLYPLCLWFGKLKQRQTGWWWSYF